jgi:hypothetical protein
VPATPAVAASGDRPAPLVLVSEQRIDRIAPSRVIPVRPRRIGGGAAAAVAPGAFEETQDAELEAELEAALMGNVAVDDMDEAFEADIDIDTETDFDTSADGDAGGDANSGNIFADSKDFAEFADRLGATQLSDLLEAAAAYATCVENRDHFTRPLLMRRLEAGYLGENFSREEGLRSFGTLLREGRIEKVRRGHYSLSERSSYLAEGRKIAK